MRAVFLDAATMRMQDLDSRKLEAACTELHQYESSRKSELEQRLKHAEIVISNKVRLDADTMKAAKHLKLICVAATGTNNVDLAAAKEQGITVCNAQGYSTESVAQHTFTLMLMLATQLHRYVSEVKQGLWQKSEMFCRLDHPIIELHGKTLGIIGYGTIGKRVAEIGKAFGMNILVGRIPGREGNDEHIELKDLLPRSDVISIHCPLSDLSRDLINDQKLNLMKKSAWLINVARGGIVNEQHLHTALVQHKIAGAALDVLSEEPPSDEHPLLRTELPNLLISPHNAWASQTARQTLLDQIAENIRAFEKGSPKRVVS
ncbi:2-hydroxyacid dehydrogenase [Permianibacter aggregans]|uniref:Glycerate dehydrogenase n=1 Tax=Permianibacter aggregans TaxID=1510150 RepID=A0A4R6UHC5_9GAMM|nr:2-hydroxyacid dehydrogenase [Permianibacter aggregans]QGX39965.1 2-hydroxyacid dehydrogenase [Permianibacter aggregans]TDQ46228.1 glycerate dehydrogenase [Permianibacter aggregans]